MFSKVISALVLVLLPITTFALENLDELTSRVDRNGVNTFYSGSGAGNSYIFQPQTLSFIDTTTGHEVWLLTQTNDASVGLGGTEYGWQPWSADGKRIAFTMDVTPGNYTVQYGYPWFVALADGSYFRPYAESPNRTSTRRPYFDWSPVEPDISYAVAYNTSQVTGLDQNAIYKITVTDTGGSYSLSCDLIDEDTSTLLTGGMKNAITSDGKYYLTSIVLENEPFYIAQITGSPALVLTYNQPTLDTYWANTPAEGQGDWHDEYFSGNSAHGYWIYLIHTAADWWRMRPWGTDNAAPDHTIDNESPYTWWAGTDVQKEIQIVNGNAGTLPDFVGNYWSHGAVDRWGTHVVYSDVDISPYGPGIWDVENSTRTGYNTKLDGVQYSAWTGWSDYAVNSVSETLNVLGATKYNSIDNDDHITVAYLHSATVNDFSNPGQSPDGTKAIMRSDWLQKTEGKANLFVGVVYYPYPPEITATAAASGTVTVTFDWRLDQASPRGYTERGWPNESTDDPPPPRETKLFRLWRSADKSAWTALGTVNAEIFTRYNFATGVWAGDTYWTITDAPGNGSWYYAVTSLEWSGLESHALSNIFAITVTGGESDSGAQDTAYPAVPGGDSNFYATAPSRPPSLTKAHKSSPATADGQYTLSWARPASYSLIRYYNVYAKDTSNPTAIQQCRIASIPATSDTDDDGNFSWVDWLGNTNGSTRYGITAVDYQGNESDILLSDPNNYQGISTISGATFQ